jgi:hypothetical protein
MLERNLLSHLKLALLLSLLSWSVLLKARLVPDDQENPSEMSGTIGVVVASLQFMAALAAILAGVWEYYCGYWDIRNMHAFLVAVKYETIQSSAHCSCLSLNRPHLAIMSFTATVVFLTCIIVLVEH